MSQVTITAADGGTFSAYLATPPRGTGPGILVAQEIFGVNKVMRDICDGFAAQGYLALCPDLFWRQEAGVDITDRTEAEWAKAFQLYQGFNETKGVNDLIAALAFLRGYPGCSGRVGCVGYCLGGKLAYLMATRSDADCCISYYGVGIEKALDEASAITRPLLMHIAEEDQFMPPEAREEIKITMSRRPSVVIYTYPKVDHAFARIGGEHYNEEAAALANSRTAVFFKTHLQ